MNIKIWEAARYGVIMWSRTMGTQKYPSFIVWCCFQIVNMIRSHRQIEALECAAASSHGFISIVVVVLGKTLLEIWGSCCSWFWELLLCMIRSPLQMQYYESFLRMCKSCWINCFPDFHQNSTARPRLVDWNYTIKSSDGIGRVLYRSSYVRASHKQYKIMVNSI